MFCLISWFFEFYIKSKQTTKNQIYQFFQFFLQNHSTQLYLFFKIVFCCVFLFFFNFFFWISTHNQNTQKNSFLIFQFVYKIPTHTYAFSSQLWQNYKCHGTNHNTHNYKWSFFCFLVVRFFFCNITLHKYMVFSLHFCNR